MHSGPWQSPLTANDNYCQTSNISGTFVGNKIADNSDVVGAAATGAAAATSSFSTKHLQWIGERRLQDKTRNI